MGDAAFAELFSTTFPRESDYWALQTANDAVPHLPFMSWGFRHPAGVILIAEQAHAPDGAPPSASRIVTDPGDSIEQLRPRAGNIENWVTCHDMNEYTDLLKKLKAAKEGHVDGDDAVPEVAAVGQTGGADDAEWGI